MYDRRGTGAITGLLLALISCLLLAYRCAAEHAWIVQSEVTGEELPPNPTPEASHTLLLKLLSKKKAHELMFELRNEFYTMATGNDFYRLVADDGENKEYHAVAEAALSLSQKLPYMGVVNGILRTAIANGAYSAHAQHDIVKAFPVIRDNIEKLMQDPPAPYDEYKRLKGEALAKASPAGYKIYYYEIPKTLADARKILAASLNDAYLKRLMVHSSFGNETRRHSASSEQTFLLAKTVLELSKSAEYGAKAQALYDEAVAETAKSIDDVEADNVSEKHVRETFGEIGKKLLKILADKFENDPTIKAKFDETKKLVANSR